MKIICIGDSLTEGDYGIKGKRGIANVKKENYPYFLAQNTGWEVCNFGKCGYRAEHYLRHYEAGNVNVENADVIVILLGTNGGNAPNVDTPNNDAYKKLLSLLKKDAPKATIILCAPPRTTENKECSGYGVYPQVVEAAMFVRQLAEKENYPLIDLLDCGAFTSENEAIMQPNDGVHFGLEGYMTLARVIEEGIRRFLPVGLQNDVDFASNP